MIIAHDITKGDRTKDVKITENITFESMLLDQNTLLGLKKSGFSIPSPIQLYGIPFGKCGFDLLLEAKSGTGKTAVFAIVALEKIELTKGLQVVILAPTREIASQISEVIKRIGSGYPGLNVEVVMGGLSVQEDIDKFKKQVHIVVASPGRLRHLINNKYIDASAVRLLVLDEADKLMENSFKRDINYIFSILPKQKQVIMSSATYPEASKQFIGNFVKNVQHICPDTTSTLLGIDQRVTIVKYHSNVVNQTQYKFKELNNILVNHPYKQCLIFCNYQARVGEVFRMLVKKGWPVEQLYGQQDQQNRLEALKSLQEYNCRILVSTDLTARGIDSQNMDLVINFEAPTDWQTYLHRIGRAGRYGAYGMAVTILSEGKDELQFKEVLGSINICFNLRKYWSDESFSIKKQDDKEHIEDLAVVSVEEVDHVVNKNLDELWNSIQCDTKEVINSESGEIHVASQFQESFPDIISSLKNYDNNNSDILPPYKCADINKLPIDEYLKSVKHNTFPERNKENYENSIQTIKQNSLKNNDIISLPQDDMDGTTPAIDDIISLPQEDKQNIVTKESKSVSSGDQALIDAGLPTAFGKTVKKTNFIVKNIDKEPHSNYKQLIKKKSLRKAIKNNPKTKSEKYTEDNQVYVNDIDTKYNQSCGSYENLDTQQSHIYPNQTGDNTHDRELKYNAWRKQFNTYIKNIECMLYMNELCRH